LEGYFKGGLVDYLGYAPDGDFLGNDTSQPEFKFLKDKGIQIVPYNKSSLKPLDEYGKSIEVTEEKYKQFLKKREQYVKEDITKLINGEGTIENEKDEPEPLPKSKVKDVTPDELKSWIMRKTNQANAKAMEDVFNGTQAPKSNDKRKVDTE
ncbi:MAG: hypothetical protein ABFC94_18085, partial [Syntrophomonas sp.]